MRKAWCETDFTDPNTEIAGVKGKIHALQKKVSYHISGLKGGNMGMLSGFSTSALPFSFSFFILKIFILGYNSVKKIM